MSTVREEVLSISDDVRPADGRAFAELPGDIWFVLLRYVSGADKVSLATASKRSHLLVCGCIRKLEISRDLVSFPDALLASLEYVHLLKTVDLFTALPTLQRCRTLRRIVLYCSPFNMDVILQQLPQFPCLEDIGLRTVEVVNGRWGKMLAECPRLCKLNINGGVIAREVSDEECISDFLSQLSRCSTLSHLHGLLLRTDEDKLQLCAALAAWPQLQELSVTLQPPVEEREDTRLASMLPVLSTLADSCSQLRALHFSSAAKLKLALSVKECQAIGRMTQLRSLNFRRVSLPFNLFTCFHMLTAVETLSLLHCDIEAVEDGGFASFIGRNPLAAVHFREVHLTEAFSLQTLRAIPACCSLRVLSLACELPLAEESRDAMAVLLADAICTSAIETWRYAISFSLLSLLRAWDARTPVAPVALLHLMGSSDTGVNEAEDFVPLLARCLRSAPSLYSFHFALLDASEATLDALAAAALEEEFPARVKLFITVDSLPAQFLGRNALHLHEAGLFLRTRRVGGLLL
eukprot:PLAT923.1.p1 GENE.PLAT923.1~~PLAT923.1.p1  ORF type:complete len:521 (-),score=54.94 PLAT923.1:229-1791(-)